MITTGTSPVESTVVRVMFILLVSHESHGHKARGETNEVQL